MENMKELLQQSKREAGRIGREYPEFMKGLGAFADAIVKDGALPVKTKELIAVAISVSKQCTYCIAYHVQAALRAGATKDEIMEAAFVATLIGGGAAFMYAKEVRQAIDELAG